MSRKWLGCQSANLLIANSFFDPPLGISLIAIKAIEQPKYVNAITSLAADLQQTGTNEFVLQGRFMEQVLGFLDERSMPEAGLRIVRDRLADAVDIAR